MPTWFEPERLLRLPVMFIFAWLWLWNYTPWIDSAPTKQARDRRARLATFLRYFSFTVVALIVATGIQADVEWINR